MKNQDPILFSHLQFSQICEFATLFHLFFFWFLQFSLPSKETNKNSKPNSSCSGLGAAETTPNGGLGVVSGTPLAPWGWLSHTRYPLGVVSATPSVPKVVFFFFLKK
jgi:hypothetical protein